MYKPNLILNNESDISLYEQIYRYIRREIKSGALPAKTKILSKRKFSKYLNVSINTIDSAYQILVSEGYIEPKPKKGYYVCPIDNMHKLDIKIKQLDEIESFIPKIDFSPSDIDSKNFSWDIFKKLYKEIFDSKEGYLLKRGSQQGEKFLRDAITSYIHLSRGVNCLSSQVIVSAGTDNLLTLFCNIIDNSSAVAVENPVYKKIYKILNNMGHKAVPVLVNKNGIPIDTLKQTDTKLLYLTPSHQFPLGSAISIANRIELLNWASENDCYIIEDDYDSEFRYTGKPIPSMQGLDSNQKVIYMGTFSKCIAPSIRISYMVLPVKLLEKYRRELAFYDCSVSIIEQKVVADFLLKGHFEKHLNKMRKIYREKRKFLISELKIFKDKIQVLGDNAGHHILLKLNSNLSETEMCELVKKEGVKVYPVSEYFIDSIPDEFSSTVILGYAGLSYEDLHDGVELLFRVWK